MGEDSEFRKSSADRTEINQLAIAIVNEVIQSASSKVRDFSKDTDLIEKTAHKMVNNAMKEIKSKEELDQIKSAALDLVNKVIEEVCEGNYDCADD